MGVGECDSGVPTQITSVHTTDKHVPGGEPNFKRGDIVVKTHLFSKWFL